MHTQKKTLEIESTLKRNKIEEIKEKNGTEIVKYVMNIGS